MFNEIVNVIQSYLQQGEVFAVAQVINRQAPSSGKIGDKAVILASGELIGWIGGGCVRGIAIKEALEAIDKKTPRLVRVAPQSSRSPRSSSSSQSPRSSEQAEEAFKVYAMTCHSEGSLDLLIEPIISNPHLVILGRSSIAQNLARVARACHFPVEVMAKEAKAIFTDLESVKDEIVFDKSYQKSYIVVATQGEGDEDAVHKALLSDARYVGFVASKKKALRIKEYLLEQKLAKERVEALISPVGIDIHAKGHSEVAISILAEIIAHFRGTASSTAASTTEGLSSSAVSSGAVSSGGDAFLEEFYINPVCQVPVSKKDPKHIVHYKGESIYFCCDGCKVIFEKNPEEYIKT